MTDLVQIGGLPSSGSARRRRRPEWLKIRYQQTPELDLNRNIIEIRAVHERLGLLLNGPGDARIAVAKIVDADPRQEVQKLPAFGVPQVAARAARHDHQAVRRQAELAIGDARRKDREGAFA